MIAQNTIAQRYAYTFLSITRGGLDRSRLGKMLENSFCKYQDRLKEWEHGAIPWAYAYSVQDLKGKLFFFGNLYLRMKILSCKRV